MAKYKYMISQQRLKELVHYDANTGRFIWRVVRGGQRIGSEAGWWAKGYRCLTLDWEKIPAHQAAWLYVYGEWPLCDLDHKDGNSANNKIANLRKATMSQNIANAKIRNNNKSGLKGVYWHKLRCKWTAQVKGMHLGLFDSAEEAHAAYKIKATELYGEFARV